MRAGVYLVCLALLCVWYSSVEPTSGEANSPGGPKKQVTLGAMVATPAPVELAVEPVTVRIALRNDARAQIEAAMAPNSATKLILTIEGINFDKTPEVYYQVYLNLPKNEEPRYKSVHFIGNLAFFGLQTHGGAAEQAPSVSFDITRVVRKLKPRNLWNDREVSVTFVVRWLVDSNGLPLPVAAGVRARFRNATIVAIAPQ